MKIFRLASVGALALATALALPVAAEAGHRHSRSCGHDSYYGGSYRGGRYDRYNDGYGQYGYNDGYGRYGYNDGYGQYGYDNDYGRRHYRPYRRHGYGHSYYSYRPYGYYAPPPVYYGPRYHRRPRVQLHLGFGY